MDQLELFNSVYIKGREQGEKVLCTAKNSTRFDDVEVQVGVEKRYFRLIMLFREAPLDELHGKGLAFVQYWAPRKTLLEDPIE